MTASREDVVGRIEKYRVRAHRKARAHYLACKYNHALHLRLGVPSVVCSTIVGTTIFAHLSSTPALWIAIATGLFSIVAAVLASLQTFFGYSEKAEKHRVAAANYNALYRDLDVLKLEIARADSAGEPAVIAALQKHLNSLSDLERSSPDVPDVMYDKAVAEQREDPEGV